MGTNADCGLRIADCKGKRGQSTLEYVLVIAAILAGVVAVVTTTIKPATEKTLSDSKTVIEKASQKLVDRVE